MPKPSIPYPEKCRQRIQGSLALERLIDVANGKTPADQGRDRVCQALLNKVLPDLKAIDVTGDLQVRGAWTVSLGNARLPD
jgi:hypothetical protein